MNNGGIDTETDYPYIGVDGSFNINKEENKVVSIDGYTNVAQSDSALVCATTVKQPISAGIDGNSLDFQLYIGSPLSPGQTCYHQVPKHLCHAAVANLVPSRNCHYASRGVGRIALRGLPVPLT
ncbi:hypothetical protein PIB30_013076 [Stylosanthes scabra]|uniref:Peptidase C1A papain C-terminal domain-containing protein n=1 Tax=Stylosanthes scabra TaxID=79078 RepID=A0ABU6U518_9FABA|nr:hypothetical protein [Stylosanthes scabra]